MAKLAVIPHPTTTNKPGVLRKLYDDLRVWAGKTLVRCGVPGLIRETVIPDEVTGKIIEVRANPLYTIISIDGRDYYFHRFTGRFGGTGSGCY